MPAAFELCCYPRPEVSFIDTQRKLPLWELVSSRGITVVMGNKRFLSSLCIIVSRMRGFIQGDWSSFKQGVRGSSLAK
ncbi:hypothetical protein WN55_05790 [Dufourea novaeangliae]|uniref:Uncharacterized protein n=1 Tax=Dufourea novaeangliae TaxID=178035 RepID=A0A154P0A8_DUFNO|nr:hypothetical protein WN55_05790 [Dufourea novaeangliae]